MDSTKDKWEKAVSVVFDTTYKTYTFYNISWKKSKSKHTNKQNPHKKFYKGEWKTQEYQTKKKNKWNSTLGELSTYKFDCFLLPFLTFTIILHEICFKSLFTFTSQITSHPFIYSVTFSGQWLRSTKGVSGTTLQIS